ncbi:MAG TPA: tRNA-dihydrouridine synthase [Candidatus Saccharimonadales bacterium]|nr:tRNA-dihydrouridine synthase [Candidatus Saccharimonadales bacterium]
MNFWQNLPKPFFVLAPMDAVTDTVFRHVVAKAAPPDVYFTEFTNTAAFYSEFGRKSTETRLLFTSDEQPMVAQIWGTNPEHYAFMAKNLAKMGFAGIDINMGCPAKDVVKTGACSALIENPELAAKLIAAAKEGGLPVSVKTRIGFKTRKTEEWISFLLNQDLAALTVHGRIQKDMSIPPADWDEIAKAVKMRDKIAPQTLIIGNGDVLSKQHGIELAKKTGVDGIMIGRGVFTNPYCFEELPTEHSRQELLELLKFHLDLYEKTWQGRKMPFAPLKRFFKIYVRDFDGAVDLRVSLMETKNIDEVRQILAKI